MRHLRNATLAAVGTTLLVASARAQITVSSINFAPLTLAAGIEDLAIADMNQDGFTDIVCAHRSGVGASAAAIVTVIYNSGVNPPFATTLAANATSSTTIIGAGATRVRIRVGQMVGTPQPDIVVYAQNGVAGPFGTRVFSILSSPTGTGTFTPTTIATPPIAGFDDFVLVDQDSDSDLDVVAVAPGNSILLPDQVFVFNNQPAVSPFPQFAGSPVLLASVSGTARMAIQGGEIDGIVVGANPDDLIVRSGPIGFETMSVLLSDNFLIYGSGGPYFLSNSNIYPAGGAQGLAMADFNLDSLTDASVYFAGANAHALVVGPFPALPSYALGSASANAGGAGGVVAAGALDATGLPHVISGDALGNMCVHFNNGAGQFNVGLTAPVCFPVGASIQRLAIGTIEGAVTPLPDVVVATGTGVVQIWGQ